MNPLQNLPALTILHLGLGSFHRAHQAVYLHHLHELGDKQWMIEGGNLRPDMADTMAALQAQNGRYTLETITPQGEHTYTRIGAIRRVFPYQDDMASLVQVAADPNTRIISFTVTEAGYYLNAKDELDWAIFPDLQSDLSRVKAGLAGHTLYGTLVTLLRQRQISASGPVTLLNCDNLRNNGDRSRNGLLQFIDALGDTSLAQWIQSHTSSPNAMVDRITPRPTPDVAERVLQATGEIDGAAIMGESFIQWVIEDNFIAGRPDWARVGVELVDSVAPYEEAKIRLLNATHSCIAWAGSLLGLHYIHEGTHHPAIRKIAFDYVTNDAIPVLSPSPFDLSSYRDAVLDRFGNPAIADTNQRVAMDAFSKIPGMIAPTIRDRLTHGQSINCVAMLPALFLVFLQRWHQGLIPYAYQDQAMDPAVAQAICQACDPVAVFADNKHLWGEMASSLPLLNALRQAHQRVHGFLSDHAA